MSYALRITYQGQQHYIHRGFDYGPDSPKTTNNMNYAKLFASEREAKSWRQRNEIPVEYEVVFVVSRLPDKDDEEEQNTGSKYKKLSSGSIDESLPDFLR